MCLALLRKTNTQNTNFIIKSKSTSKREKGRIGEGGGSLVAFFFFLYLGEFKSQRNRLLLFNKSNDGFVYLSCFFRVIKEPRIQQLKFSEDFFSFHWKHFDILLRFHCNEQATRERRVDEQTLKAESAMRDETNESQYLLLFSSCFLCTFRVGLELTQSRKLLRPWISSQFNKFMIATRHMIRWWVAI